jgi:hypothetical protein
VNLNFLDVHDEYQIRDGETAIEVSHMGMTAKLKRSRDLYYCDRLVSLSSTNPHWLALHLVHPDYLYEVVDEIILDRAKMPDYF